MSGVIEKLKSPVVAVADVPVPTTDVGICELLVETTFDATIPAVGLTRVPRKGDALCVTCGGLAIKGHARSVRRVWTTAGETLCVSGVCQSAPLRPRSVCFRKKSRSFCLRALLPNTPVATKAGPVGDEQRLWLSLLSGTPWHVAARLALCGGQLLLNSAAGAVLVRPDQPGAATPLPGSAFYSINDRAAPGLSLIAPDPKEWGKVLTKEWAPGGPEAECLVLHLGEAVSATELAAAGTAIRAAVGLGEFEAHGGPELLGVGPGDWVAHPDGSKHLVTARMLNWTQAGGWRGELRGGYPWSWLAHEAVLQDEPAEVTGFDEESGRLTVRLPWHDGVVIGVFPQAERGAADSYRLNVPAVGERGIVRFAHAADHGLYGGPAAPTGALTRADFDKAVEVARTPGSSYRHLNDGTVECTWKSFRVVCQKAMEHVASLFRFNKG